MTPHGPLLSALRAEPLGRSSDAPEEDEMIDERTGPPADAADADQDQGEQTARLTSERRKVTGPELEARFDRWTAARRTRSGERSAARTPESRRRTARQGVAVTLGLVLAAAAVLSAVTNRAYDQQSAANARRISALQAQSPVAPGGAPAPTATPVDGKAVAVLSARASEIARAVTAQQDEYAGLFHAANQAPDAGNGVPNEAILKTVEHRRALARHWDPKSFVVDEPLAYAFTTTPYFGRDEIDPRFPWYVRYDGLKASDPKSYGWKVESVMPKLDVPTTVRVVWVCKDNRGMVLAWASATYTDSTRTFSELELVVTTAGRQHQPETDAAKADKVPDLGEGTEQKP